MPPESSSDIGGGKRPAWKKLLARELYDHESHEAGHEEGVSGVECL